MYQVVAPQIRCQLGEGLLWSARENAVYWVDIIGQRLHRYSLENGDTTSWSMPEKTGWLVERRSKPGFIAGMQSGFVELTLDPLTIHRIADPEPHLPGNRMNDCCVDHHGHIWAGTMDVPIEKATGSLYRLDADHNVTHHDSGYLVTNGPAFSPSRDRMYHNDTGRGVVYRFDLTADGIANKREFIRFRKDWGVPDGMTVDAEGHLWIAHWGGSCVSRFTPEGERVNSISLPASQITNVVFAGEKLDRLFVTSAADGREQEEPLAGSLFEVDTGGVKGLPPNLFAG